MPSSPQSPRRSLLSAASSVVVQVDFRRRQSFWRRYWPVLLGSMALVMMVLVGGLYTSTVFRQYHLQTLASDNRQLVEANRQLEARLLNGQSFHRLHAELGQAPYLAPASEKLLVKLPKTACRLTVPVQHPVQPPVRRVYGY